jgi:peptidyl-prolyl cis-trans isomerase B (cyclophilin B)
MTSSHKFLLILTLVPLLALAACGSNGSGGKTSGDVTASSSAKPAASQGQCTYTKDGSKAVRPVKLPPANPPKKLPKAMTISTNRGDIKVSLDTAQAPCTVNSFVSLARQGYFDHTRCHRLTTSGIYVLQCGDPTATGTGGPGYTFPDELHSNDPRIQPCQTQGGQELCTYGPGTLAMANAGPNTNGSQFFLVYDKSPLANSYTVFGRMTASGLRVVQDIAKKGATPPDSNGMTAPKESVVVTSVS